MPFKALKQKLAALISRVKTGSQVTMTLPTDNESSENLLTKKEKVAATANKGILPFLVGVELVANQTEAAKQKKKNEEGDGYLWQEV